MVDIDFSEKDLNPDLPKIGWSCRWNYGRLRVIKDAFQKKGIPFVSIDCDSASSQNYFEGQLNSRIDTFLDMLG